MNKLLIGTAFGVMSFLFFWAGSCDQTDLYGDLMYDSDTLVVGVQDTMLLQLPDEYEDVYGIEWIDLPDSLVELTWKQGDTFDTGFKGDRELVVLPLKVGEVLIEVYGYYKQTNAQYITQRSFYIVEPTEEPVDSIQN